MDEFYLILAVSTALMGMAFAGLSVSILVRKNGRFPVTSIGRNKAMQKRGITCVKHDEMLCRGNPGNKASCCG
jgi:hypothetical protein